MVIAITGGTGFVGKQLVNHHIQLGHQVRLLSRKSSLKEENAKFFIGDLSDPNVDLSSFLHSVDILYHCAGEINNEHLMQELHVNGTQRLIEAAKGRIEKWVQLSSVGAYGICRAGTISESSIEKPFKIYEHSKAESDRLVKQSGIPHVILRPSNVFGNNMPNQSLRGLIRTISSGIFFFI